MSKFHLRFLITLPCLFFFALVPIQAGTIQAIEVAVALPAQIPDQFADTEAEYGVAEFELDGATQLPIPLGGIQADTSGDLVYLALNKDLVTPATPRVIQFPKANVSLVQTVGATEGFVSTATASTSAPFYVTNTDLLPAAQPHLFTDRRGDHILGMSVDTNSNDLYAAVQDGVGSKALLRFVEGTGTTSAVVEFASTGTDLSNQLLNPYFAPLFSDVMMGPESVAHLRQPDASDLVFFTDGTGFDFAVNWAVEDLPHQRVDVDGVFNAVVNAPTPDTDFYTDEMRVHANLYAGDFLFDPASPHVLSDIVYVPSTEQMLICTGRDANFVLVDDLDDNTESIGSDGDFPQLTAIPGYDKPSALSNVFDAGNFDSNRDILVADYDETNTSLWKIRFSNDPNNPIQSHEQLDLSTTDDQLPGRISQLTMDSDGTIYAVDIENGLIYVVALNQPPTPTPTITPIPTDTPVPTHSPTPIPPFDCFETDSQIFAVSGRFTAESLVSYAASVRGETDVITELKLIDDTATDTGDLEDFLLPAGSADIRRFFYVNRPIKISTLDRLSVNNGEWFIFRCDGTERAYLEVNGRLVTGAEDYFGPNSRFSAKNREEGEIRYTSVIGFISWLKERGVTSFADLDWTPPAGDQAATDFIEFCTRELSSGGPTIFDAVHSTGALALDPDLGSGDPGSPYENDYTAYRAQERSRLHLVLNEIEDDVYGHPGTGRWGGIYFSNSDIGSSSGEASSIEYSRVELAEVGVYCQDTDLNEDLVRDENALRIVRNVFQGNLMGLSFDGFSPLVAYNTIRDCTFEDSFDDRDFGDQFAWPSACNLDRATERFPIGTSGTGVFITKRVAVDVPAEPLFFVNNIYDNLGNGVQILQPGVGGFPGLTNPNNRPKPLFGGEYVLAHEIPNLGKNNIFQNGGDLADLRYQNFVYNVEEMPADFGEANPDHEADIVADLNFWGSDREATLEMDIRDGKDTAGLGEVITSNFISSMYSSVEDSTELYK